MLRARPRQQPEYRSCAHVGICAGTTCAVKWDSGRLDPSLLLADLIVKKAPGGAASITELLGMTVCDAYDRVCGQRSVIRSRQQSLEQQIKPFHDLVLIFKDILKGHSRGDCPGVENVKLLAADLEEAAKKSEITAAMIRQNLGASQLEIRDIVASHAQKLDTTRMEPVDDLPDDIQGKIKGFRV